jgi:hypothetical protein
MVQACHQLRRVATRIEDHAAAGRLDDVMYQLTKPRFAERRYARHK